ncbi:AfsR/SARP family transcriptional regulator [Kibdelosporangium persicum]|uniref:Transcriptional regulator n=1 Tax=Kibdelosporangium persicum TaxID=2698649 RepID=A0ABX2FFJ7_9PSEU|nr:AfsR/SARP family transcriptional regulator [Kibdelosporangium persicum]NRN70163.1 Transcriptional regulator [Kibdelosporangium persicum]
MEFWVLGPLEVRDQGQVVDLGAPRVRLVCGLLLARPGDLVAVEQFVDELWPDQPPPDARALVRGYVSRLRRALRSGPSGADRVVTRKPGYLLQVEDQELDVQRFERLVAEARSARQAGQPRRSAELFRRAHQLWRGSPFADVPHAASIAAVSTWLIEHRLTTREEWFDVALAAGQDAEVVTELTEFVTAHPLRERSASQLMLALYRCGRQAEALEQYQRTRRIMADEIGVEPGAKLQHLHQRILNADPTLANPTDPPDVVEADDAAATSTSAPATTSASLEGEHESRPGRPARESTEVVAWRQLPMDIAEFTGRQAELATLHGLADVGEPDLPTAVVISAIEGMAGVGKTRLAVHLAHRLINRGRYDDVQLWTDLRGFDADHPPADPADVLESFLRLLGVPGDHIPPDVESRAALYRDRLAEKRALILLDNAVREEQVRPLLPGRPGCFVLITSRRSLSSLDGAHAMRLDVLSPEEAVQLMAQIATDDRIATQRHAAARVANLCGHLPIALTLAARRLRTRPRWTVSDLADRLAGDADGLQSVSPQTRGLNSTFDLSYRAISADQQRMFRLLGLHVGNDITAESAAALAGWTRRQAEEVLEALLDEHLLQQEIVGRYRFHDLIRPYARHLADTEETSGQRVQALHRLLTWYLHAAAAAHDVFDPHRTRITDLELLPTECTVPKFRDYEQALVWYEAERANLVAAIRAAHPHGLPEVAWQLAWVMMSFFYRRSYWDDWISSYHTGLAAAQAVGNQHGEATMYNGLGVAHSDLRQYTTAIDCHERAQIIFESINNQRGQAWNLNNLGVVYVDLHRLDEAADCFQRALPIFRSIGDTRGEGICLNNLGDTTRRLGDTEAAITYLTDALAIQQRREDHGGLQFTLTTLGDLHQDTHQYDIALEYYKRAMTTSRQLDDQRTTARTLTNLAKTHRALGNIPAAIDHWRQAHTIFTDLSDPQADEIADELTEAIWSER